MKDKLVAQVLQGEIALACGENNQHFSKMYGGEWGFGVEERTYPQPTSTVPKPGLVLTLSVVTTSPEDFPGFSVHPNGSKYKKLWQRAYDLSEGLTACRVAAYRELLSIGVRTFNGLSLTMEPEELDQVSNPTSHATNP